MTQSEQVSAIPVEATINLNWNETAGPTPANYGVEYTWIDQDGDLFIERYRQLGPKVLRVQISQQFFEPVNDNSDPQLSAIDFNVTLPIDTEKGKTVTFKDMFSSLASEFPEMQFHINVWLAATWNASDPDGYLGLGGAFPPQDMAEHEEFVRELARWLVETAGIAPERLSFSFVNEPNLKPFFVGNKDELVQMAQSTRNALNEVSPAIKLYGLDEVHGTSWTDDFYKATPNGCCDGWTFHSYEKGIPALQTSLETRLEQLQNYGPVWVTEFADTNNGSPDAQMDFSTRQAALGFAQLLGPLWASGIDGLIHFRMGDTYIEQFNSWAGHGLFSDWRGSKTNGTPYVEYPSFWVFANLYNHFSNGQIIPVSSSADLSVMAVRRDDLTPPQLSIWLTNTTNTPYTTQVTVEDFYAPTAQISILDNLSGSDVINTLAAQNTPLQFEITIPAQGSNTILVQQNE